MMEQLEIFMLNQNILNQRQRLNYALNDTKNYREKKFFPYVLLGVLIGAVIHNWIPQEFILSILGDNNPFAVILATIIGIPIYADIFGTLPIAEALYLVGVPAGTILALMMAITALSLPSLYYAQPSIAKKIIVFIYRYCKYRDYFCRLYFLILYFKIEV